MRKRSRKIKSNLGAYLGVFLIVFVFSMLLSYIALSKNIGNIMSYLTKGKERLSSKVSEVEESLENILGESSSENESTINVLEPSGIEDDSSTEKDNTKLRDFVTPSDIDNWLVPEVQPTDNEYFQYALFVGDSLISGLKDSKDSMVKFSISRDEIEPQKAMTEEIFGTSGNQTTMINTMKKYNPSRIYIMLGGRSLTYFENKDCVSYYKTFIKAVKAQHPTTPIFIHSVLPVTKAHEASSNYDNAKIDSLNLEIKQICQSENVYFLDAAEDFKDKSGYLNSDFAGTDGKKLNSKGYDLWEKYLKSHWIEFK